MNVRPTFHFILILVIALVVDACRTPTKKAPQNEVVVYAGADPDMLNPVNSLNSQTSHLSKFLFQQLINIDHHTLELVPVLAESLPQLEELPDNKLKITYRIRKEARWDNGTPITAKDVAFSMKVIKCPGVDNARMKPYFEFIEDIIFYPEDPLKFSYLCKEKYILTEIGSGDYSILPAYVYDPQGLLANYTIKQFNEKGDSLKETPDIKAFAESFNSEKYQRDSAFISGSGAYRLSRWETGQRIVLTKKEQWWGSTVPDKHDFFEAYPDKITFETVTDKGTALVALKSGKLHVMRDIPPKDFLDLKVSEKFTADYHLHTPISVGIFDIRLNVLSPKLSDKKVRKALAHLVNVDKIIETVLYGFGVRVSGPVHPAKEGAYHSSLEPYGYDPGKSKKLLEDAGWKDTDADGIVDKTIDGERVSMELEFLYNSSNDIRKAIGLIFQEEARKIGIKVNVSALEWSVFLKRQRSHDFELLAGGSGAYPAVPWDPKQNWHTDSYNKGSNYSGFGNAETDALIEEIRIELDEEKRNRLTWKLQEIIHEEVPHIFLYSKQERIAIHKRFDNAEPSVIRPGYWEAGFRLMQ